MDTDPLPPQHLIALQATMEAIYHVTMMEVIDALIEQGCLDPERMRAKLARASDEISMVPLAGRLTTRAASPGVRLLQQLSDEVAKRHGLPSQVKS